MGTIREVLNAIFDAVYNFFNVGIKAGVGYENTPDGWKVFKIGQRMNAVLNYTTALGTSSSYTSSSISVQDGAGNNYTMVRISFYQEGSTDVKVRIEQSDDNSTWRDFGQSLSLSADGGIEDEFRVQRGYIRIVEENNDASNAQTTNDLLVEVV